MFGARRAFEKALALIAAENADLKQRVRDVEAEKRELLDRILVLTHPGALREVKRPLPPRNEVPPSAESENHLHRFPGNKVMMEPTRPATPPVPRLAPTSDSRLQQPPTKQTNPPPVTPEKAS